MLINILAVLLLRRHMSVTLLDTDEREYWDIATRLHAVGLSGVTPGRTLPYPLVILIIRSLVGDGYLSVQLVFAAILALTPVLVFVLVRRCLDDRLVASIAGISTMLWPTFLNYGATLYSDSFGLLTFLLFLLAWPKLSSNGDSRGWWWGKWAVAGILLGVALETKPEYIVYLPFALLLTAISVRPMRRCAPVAAVFLLGCAVAVAPWSAYMSHREGRLIVVSANGGMTLAGGLNPTLLKMSAETTWTTVSGRKTWRGPGKWLPPYDTGLLSPAETKLPFVKMNSLLLERAEKWVFSHPGSATYLMVRKLLYMWGIYPFWNGLEQTLLGNALVMPLTALAAAGLWLHRRRWKQLAVFWTLPVFCSAVALISWGSWRFRMTGDVGLIVLASMCAAAMIRRRWAITPRYSAGEAPSAP